MEDSGIKISEDDVLKIEKKLNANLPHSYKKFLMSYNGGKPIESNIDFDGSKIKISGDSIKRFFGISEKPSNDLLHKMESIGDYIPEKTFFIANTHSGNFFILSLREDSYGKIYYKDHEVEDKTEFDPSNNKQPESLVFVADSFDDFISRLYDPDTDQQ